MPATPESFLERLVAVPSMSSASSQDAVAAVLDLAQAQEAEQTLQPYDGGLKTNVLLQRGPRSETGDGLTLAGHLDVVPAEEEDWESDPWTLTDSADRWVGRGACDMKGFIALALDRFRRLDRERMRAPLALLLTADEEVGSIGAQRWVTEHAADSALPSQIVIGEPTELAAVRLHKGHLRLRLTIRGRPAHSGYPHRGESAIEPAGPALAALAALRRQLESESGEASEHFPEIPFVTLNVGRIAGGTATNVIPDLCTIDLGLRPLPGMVPAELTQRVEAALARALEGSRWSLEVDNDSPPLLTRPDAPLYEALCDLLQQQGDVGVSFSSDGGTLARTGADCVLFGPGSIEVAHRANEFLPKDQFVRAGEVLDDLIERFCGARPR